MISLPSGTRIWLVAGVTDMCKSFNGLGEQVQHVLNDNPFSGHLFIFRGRRGDTVKILWADADGLCLFTKRLEEGQFIWPAVRDGKVSITRSQLAMYSAAIFLIPICISFDTAEKRRYATYLILNRRFSFEF
ncbi:IS66 family insertion sequence element accessory protein TnpB [Escherichia coli]